MSRRILVADDSVTIRKIVEITFSDTDIRVDAVASGAEALERFSQAPPDLVIADVVMPGPSGYEVCARIKASARPVPVLLLAGTFEPFDRKRAVSCGADGHLVKPFESRTLVDRVEDLLSRREAAAPPPSEPALASARIGEPLPPAPWELGAAAPAEEGAAIPAAGPEAAAPADGQASLGAAEDVLCSVPALPSGEFFDAVVHEVVRRLSKDVVQEIAWDVVPDLAETIIRDRLRDIERDERERG